MNRKRPRPDCSVSGVAPPVPVEYRSAEVLGRGIASEVSTTGLFIDGVLLPLPRGTQVGIRFPLSAGSCQSHIRAEVVRRTETGFAVRFLK
jgi:hypothetical protein